jgi:hypothetical protein
MRIHFGLGSLFLLGIVCGAAVSVSRAAPGDEGSPEEQAATVAKVWQTSQVLQVPILRLAVSESNVDGAAKKQATEALLKYESELRQMIADAQKDPSQAAQVLEKLRTFQGKQNAAILSLFSKEQWEEIGKRNSSIALQLTALSSDPQSFMSALNGPLKLTEAQKAKIDPLVTRMAEKLKSFKADLEHADDPAAHGKLVIGGFDAMLSAAIDARSEMRKALTADQIKRLDSGVSYGPSNEIDRPKTEPTTKTSG